MEKYAQIGRVSTASVFKATRKHWNEWIEILDKAGARSWTHQEIVAFLKKRHKLGPWWQQGVAVGFEIATGRRVEGQNLKGEYMVTTTKSLSVPAAKAWKKLISEKGVTIWLKPLFKVPVKEGTQFETEDGYFGEIRTIKKARRLRLSWSDPDWLKKTVVQVTLVDRPKEKSILVIDHTQILDSRVQARMRARWRTAADELALLITSA